MSISFKFKLTDIDYQNEVFEIRVTAISSCEQLSYSLNVYLFAEYDQSDINTQARDFAIKCLIGDDCCGRPLSAQESKNLERGLTSFVQSIDMSNIIEKHSA